MGKTSLSEFMSALVSARLVICNDSGAMHVASALGVPTLSIFGSTEPALTGPMGAGNPGNLGPCALVDIDGVRP